jgi:hypothetical protein
MVLGSVALTIVVLRACKGLVESLSPVLIRQLELVDKATTIAASSDLQAYQGIQAMSQPIVGYDGDTYDPSDEAEAQREAERLGLNFEEMSNAEQEQLRGLLS